MSSSKSTRDLRQEQCIRNWLKAKGVGTIVATTGMGKTRCALLSIKLLLSKYQNLRVLVVVPTITLKEQWTSELDKWGFSLNCNVEVINTVITRNYECDMLIIDEIHTVPSITFREVFNTVKYKYILGLTATFERLDGKHEIVSKYCPICDEVTVIECLANGWISPYKEYQVIIDVDDIDTYKNYQKEFTEMFEFFNFDYSRVQRCIGPKGFIECAKLRDEMCPRGTEEQRKEVFKTIRFKSQRFMQLMQARKKFINNHQKKIELAKRIIEARPFSKIITFSNSISMAEKIGGPVYSGKDSKKKGRMTIEEFSKISSGVLNTIRRADAGLDIPGLSVAIVIGTDSSKLKATQRLGRTVRFEEGKEAEVFYIIINETVELDWFAKSHSGQPYITIDEEGLNDVLAGNEPKPYTKKLKQFTFRF